VYLLDQPVEVMLKWICKFFNVLVVLGDFQYFTLMADLLISDSSCDVEISYDL
jgi:hypothetical protein